MIEEFWRKKEFHNIIITDVAELVLIFKDDMLF